MCIKSAFCALFICTGALDLWKGALQIRNRALQIRKRALQIYKRAPNLRLDRRVYRLTGYKAKNFFSNLKMAMEHLCKDIPWPSFENMFKLTSLQRSCSKAIFRCEWPPYVQISNHLKTFLNFKSFENMFNFPSLKKNKSNRRANQIQKSPTSWQYIM